MGLLDKFFKKKQSYDATDIGLNDLQQGFLLDYDLKTWELTEAYTYDWGDEYFTKEFKIVSEDGHAFLSLEEDDELEISLSHKLHLTELGKAVLEELQQGETPREIEFEGNRYSFESERAGYYNDAKKGDQSWIEVVSRSYEASDGNSFLCIDQWGETEFEASKGEYLKEYEISNILPK